MERMAFGGMPTAEASQFGAPVGDYCKGKRLAWATARLNVTPTSTC